MQFSVVRSASLSGCFSYTSISSHVLTTGFYTYSEHTPIRGDVQVVDRHTVDRGASTGAPWLVYSPLPDASPRFEGEQPCQRLQSAMSSVDGPSSPQTYGPIPCSGALSLLSRSYAQASKRAVGLVIRQLDFVVISPR